MIYAQLPVPPSTNHLYVTRQGRRYKALAYRQWLRVACALLRLNLPPVERYPVAVLLTACGGRGWSSLRDLDNVAKPTLDALVASERLAGDRTHHVSAVFLTYRGQPKGARACLWVALADAITFQPAGLLPGGKPGPPSPVLAEELGLALSSACSRDCPDEFRYFEERS